MRASKMLELCAYSLNGGDMLELVRYQEKELPIAAEMEKQILLPLEIIRSERKRHGQIGKNLKAEDCNGNGYGLWGILIEYP